MYKSYVAVAPHPEDFPKLLDTMGELHAQAVRLVGGREEADDAGDARSTATATCSAPSTSSKFYQLLGGGLKDAGWQREHMSQNRLAILPNVTHYEMGVAPQMVETALPFLNGYARAGTWAEQVKGTK